MSFPQLRTKRYIKGKRRAHLVAEDELGGQVEQREGHVLGDSAQRPEQTKQTHQRIQRPHCLKKWDGSSFSLVAQLKEEKRTDEDEDEERAVKGTRGGLINNPYHVKGD